MKISERGIYMFSKAQKEKYRSLIDSFTNYRVHKFCEDFNSTKKYQDFMEEAQNICAELEKTLSEESMILVVEYGDLHTCIAVEEYENFYRQGFRDCFKLVKSLIK